MGDNAELPLEFSCAAQTSECFWFLVKPSRFSFQTLGQPWLLPAHSQEIGKIHGKPCLYLRETSLSLSPSFLTPSSVAVPRLCLPLQSILKRAARVLLLKYESKDVSVLLLLIAL